MPSPHLEAEIQHQLERIAFGVRDLQLLPALVEHVDGEHRERRQAGDQSRNAPQQLVEIEHRRHFAAELEQRGDEFLIVGTRSGFSHGLQTSGFRLQAEAGARAEATL